MATNENPKAVHPTAWILADVMGNMDKAIALFSADAPADTIGRPLRTVLPPVSWRNITLPPSETGQ